jgi:hypothetical protein
MLTIGFFSSLYLPYSTGTVYGFGESPLQLIEVKPRHTLRYCTYKYDNVSTQMLFIRQ